MRVKFLRFLSQSPRASALETLVEQEVVVYRGFLDVFLRGNTRRVVRKPQLWKEGLTR